MAHDHIPHIPIYDCDKYRECHWFICETIWDAFNVTNEDKQIVEFIGTLRKRALTWYLNFTKNKIRYRSGIK